MAKTLPRKRPETEATGRSVPADTCGAAAARAWRRGPWAHGRPPCARRGLAARMVRGVVVRSPPCRDELMIVLVASEFKKLGDPNVWASLFFRIHTYQVLEGFADRGLETIMYR